MKNRLRQPTLADVGEIELIERMVRATGFPPEVVVGPGDDCAQLCLGGRNWLWTTDAQIEGTHFERSWMTPRQVGRRAYLVNASDVASMGGQPRFALVSLSAPAGLSARDLIAVQRGVEEMASRDGVCVVGGNVARSPGLQVTISLLGEAPRRAVLRSGARPGDALYVTGSLGGAALGLRQLRENPRAAGAAVRRFREPSPRLQAGAVLARRNVASAMIDLSDGLLDDLARLCRASKVGSRLDVDALPLSPTVRRSGVSLALAGGEDYELLCAVPARKEKLLASLSAELGCAMTRIGVCCDVGVGVTAVGRTGGRQVRKFAHFAPERRG